MYLTIIGARMISEEETLITFSNSLTIVTGPENTETIIGTKWRVLVDIFNEAHAYGLYGIYLHGFVVNRYQ